MASVQEDEASRVRYVRPEPRLVLVLLYRAKRDPFARHFHGLARTRDERP